MSIIPQNNQNEQELNNTISSFIKDYKISQLLRICRAEKEKGISALTIFQYLLCIVFSGRSMFMQMKTNSFRENFSKNTVYRFLNSTKTNWYRFITLLSERIINQFFRPLTDASREDVFIIDDTLYSRAGYKRSELVSKVFDHVSMKYKKGFRLLTLGWSDGNSFVPINYSLLATPNEKNILGVKKDYDRRSLAGRRRKLACEKATDVMVQLLKTAVSAGHTARYVLFDTWFSSPKTITAIKEECGLDTVAMIKKSSKIHYCYNGESLNIKQIYSRNKKRRGRSRYLLSVAVTIKSKDSSGNEPALPAKIVCVRNTKNRKDWIAIICTNPELSEEEIIRIYGKRWDIEVFFKTCKSRLNLGKECHSLSYDAVTAHVALVFTRYMILSLEQRRSKDERSICELFYILVDELADITFHESLRLIITAMLESICALFKISDEQLEALTIDFTNRLPKYIQEALGCAKIS